MYSFPKDVQIRKAWIEFVNKEGWVPIGISYLCSQHFGEQQFDRTSMLKVRLQPNAVPTVEVTRLKYERSLNSIHTVVKVEKENAVLVTPGPSREEKFPTSVLATPVCSQQLQEDTPRNRALKRKISELQRREVLKNQKVRKLQKIIWRQKRRISVLSTMLAEFKKKTIILEEHETVEDIIQRLFQKTSR
ncbi:hypothetical protein PPYR_00634 [Photinus pyralis]|uniref:THAP-type domain-containing protein n=1 Tax=Photinus pyralis TaxID=7054 RepID=A0A1Y1JY24_PHOPY|nr:hypothetical protein PPYR_00634 [Photinus pyralis]